MEKAREEYEKGNKELWEQIQEDQAKEMAEQIDELIKKDDDRTN